MKYQAFDIVTGPATGSMIIKDIPSEYDYCYIQTNNNYAASLYRGQVVDINKLVVTVQQSNILNIPLTRAGSQIGAEDFLLTWAGSAAADKIRIVFSTERLAANQQNSIPGVANVTVIGPLNGSGAVRVTMESDTTGVYTTPAHTQVAVGVASTSVLAANANRKYALIVNDSANVIYLMLGADADVTGIRLNPAGGSYEISAKQGNLYRGAINAICLVAAQNLNVVEGV